MNVTDYTLGHDLSAQKELLDRAYKSGEEQAVEEALSRIVLVRRMKKNGTLDWHAPDAET